MTHSRAYVDQFPYQGQAPKALWIASPGGHLTEALRIEEMLGRNPDSLWITSRTEQTSSLLSGRRVTYQPYVPPRDLRGSFRVSRDVGRVIRAEEFDLLASTGAALAAASLVLNSRSLDTVYIESLARMTGPSTTGKIASLSPSTRLFTQSANWASRRWAYAGSVLDSWAAERSALEQNVGRLKILVTLGTIRPYRFDRLVDAVLAIIQPGDEVVWQLGSTIRSELHGKVIGEAPAQELAEIAASSDLVVSHAGVGSLLMALGVGKCPVIAARSRTFQEHVDDHQSQLVPTVARAGLAFELDLTNPSRAVFEQAASTHIVDRANPSSTR